MVKFLKKVLVKIILGLLVSIFLGPIGEVLFMDTDSDTDSDSESKDKKTKASSSKSPESKFDIDNMNNADVTADQLTEECKSIPRLGTLSSFDSRVNAMMSKFIALNLESIKDEIGRLGLDKREASTPHEKELMERFHRESAALAHSSQLEFKAKLQLEKDKLALDQAQSSSSTTGVKREAEAPNTSQTIPKKIHLDTDTSKSKSISESNDSE